MQSRNALREKGREGGREEGIEKGTGWRDAEANIRGGKSSFFLLH